MSNQIPFGMIGAAGRMGQTIIELAINYQTPDGSEFRLQGALDQVDSEWIGRELHNQVMVSSNINQALIGCKVVIDFSAPANTIRVLEYCCQHNIASVIGTTGFSDEQHAQIKLAGAKIPVLLAPNMSVGVNLLFELTRLTSRILKKGYDIEIVEAHHHYKKDAPSGTAMRLKEVLLDELNRKESDVAYGRQGMLGPRSQHEIGVHSLRGGDVVGDHTVYFLGDGERIELTHKASSRSTFAAGALMAAAYLNKSKAGSYNMRDILGLDTI